MKLLPENAAKYICLMIYVLKIHMLFSHFYFTTVFSALLCFKMATDNNNEFYMFLRGTRLLYMDLDTTDKS